MRFTNLFALAAVAGAASTASAQGSSASTEGRVRIATPSIYRYDSGQEQPEHRAALGVETVSTGTLRDTLGLMISSIIKGSPAEKSGLEEGNRLAAINGVSLKANPADIEDGEMSSALTRRLVRELGKVKAGDEVELRVYRDGRTQAIKVKTVDAYDLFRPTNTFVRTSREDMDNRPALGISLGNTGSRRDTLGVLVMGVADSTPAAKAGIEEGNRIAAINGVNLRVSHEDAGDRYLSSSKAQRLQREISQLKPGDNVTLRVYGDGKFRDVTLKVARAGDLPKSARGGFMFFGGDGAMAFPSMPPMPAMPAMPPMPSMAPMAPMHFDVSPEIARRLDEARVHIEAARPRLQYQLQTVRPQLDNLAPQLQRLRTELQRTLEPVRSTRIRMVHVIV